MRSRWPDHTACRVADASIQALKDSEEAVNIFRLAIVDDVEVDRGHRRTMEQSCGSAHDDEANVRLAQGSQEFGKVKHQRRGSA